MSEVTTRNMLSLVSLGIACLLVANLLIMVAVAEELSVTVSQDVLRITFLGALFLMAGYMVPAVTAALQKVPFGPIKSIFDGGDDEWAE